jgi:hypothetical protein
VSKGAIADGRCWKTAGVEINECEERWGEKRAAGKADKAVEGLPKHYILCAFKKSRII